MQATILAPATVAIDTREATVPAPPVVDVVVPVYDEAHVLEASIRRLHAHLARTMPFTWRITVADNASTDGTATVARALADDLDGIRVLCLDRKGRGRALKAAWASSDAAVLAYMDVDLSTGLDALLPLVAPLVSGHSDLAIGSRLARGSDVARGPRREVISRTYNLILRSVFAARFTDAQCGFKAIRADAAEALLPEVEDDAWFFDTELLLLAEHNLLRIHEVPVDWVDDPDSRVDVARTARDDLRGVLRMARRFATGRGTIDGARYHRDRLPDDLGRQLVSFGTIGAVSTAISLALFLVLRAPLGPLAANAVAWLATAVANVWANRRYTFRRDAALRRRDYRRGAALALAGLALSTGALVAVGALGGGVVAEVVALLASWGAVAVGRFLLFRHVPREVAP